MASMCTRSAGLIIDAADEARLTTDPPPLRCTEFMTAVPTSALVCSGYAASGHRKMTSTPKAADGRSWLLQSSSE
jgi:hypothetical protein